MAYRLITSRTRSSIPDDTGCKRKDIDLAPGERREICHIQGTGTIVRFWCTVPLIGQRWTLKNLILRIFWDGENHPSIEAPVGDFFGAAFGKPHPIISDKLVVAGGGYLCRFEMPFNHSARIEIENDSHTSVRHFFFQLGWREEPGRKPLPTLHAQYRQQRSVTSKPLTLLRAHGHGTLVGVRIDMQCREWWLRFPLREIPLPRGFGLGMLEGWETIVVDGDDGSAIVGTGVEDYFSGGFYFRGGPFCTPTHGCTIKSFLTGRVSAYRFHIDDPIDFAESIEFQMDHGLQNSMAVDCASVAYWYQHEPHSEAPPLPPAVERRPCCPGLQIAQWMVWAAIVVVMVTLFIWVLSDLT